MPKSKSSKSKGGFDATPEAHVPGPVAPPSPAPAPAPAPAPPSAPEVSKYNTPMSPPKLNSIEPLSLIKQYSSPSVKRNVQFHVNYPTITALALALIYILTQIMVFKKTDMSYYHILLLIFIWPSTIEILSRNLNNMDFLIWLLSILPMGIILSYEGYKYYKNRNLRNLKKLLRKEEKEDEDEDELYIQKTFLY